MVFYLFFESQEKHVLKVKTGPIYSLRVLWKPMVVLNSADVALELLEARSGMYWSRPIPKMVEL